MPEFIGGLPLHPLVVHFTVVLLVLAAAGAVLTAVWPLAAACVVTGVLCLAGSLWVWRRVAASEATRMIEP